MADSMDPARSANTTSGTVPPSPRLDLPPSGTYRERLTVRSYEAGPGDVVRPGTILRYLEHLATRASAVLGHSHTWYEERGEAFVVNRMRLLLCSPARMDQTLECATWVVAYRRALATRDYAIWHTETGQPVARASARWAYIDVNAGRPRRVPEELMDHSGTHGHEITSDTLLSVWGDGSTPQESALATSTRTLTARSYEADTRTHINNCAYVDWLEDALGETMRQEGLAPDRYRAREYRIDYTQQVWPGERLLLTTRLLQPRQRVLIAHQQITTESGARVVAATSAHLRLLGCATTAEEPVATSSHLAARGGGEPSA